MATAVHLVRHGRVENPKGVIYGRLPGYSLSKVGEREAEAAAAHLRSADVGAVWASPLERTQETARIIAAPHGIEVTTDERVIESGTNLQGVRGNVLGVLLSPKMWVAFRNPLKPTWGESFAEIRVRMLDGIAAARAAAGGGEVVIVSHQTPVVVARLALARSRIPPWLRTVPCHTGSVTTLVMDGDRLVSASYFKPPD